MAKTEVIHARIDSELKKNVEDILNYFGISLSEAIKIYCKQIEINRGLPFNLRFEEPRYNAETLEAIEEGRRLANDPNAEIFNNVDDLRRAMGL